MASTASAVPAYLLPGVAVYQPSHLEGDPALATEILPGPPPLVSIQQSGQKRDPKKPAVVYSYLPACDPGTSYSGIVHGTLIGQESIAATGKRTRMDKSAVTGRAQRASARNQPTTAPSADGPPPTEVVTSTSAPTIYTDSDSTMVVDDTPNLSRSTSLQIIIENGSTNGRSKRKDKGKGRETDGSVRVKEEPSVAPLLSPEPPTVHSLTNEDHCSSCRSQGSQLVYCDGCPKAFHLWCLDPPLEKIDEGDTKWFCPACNIRKHPPRKPPPSFISPLIHLVETSIPTEYQLPSDLRNFYKDVATGARGTYVDTSEIKQPRLNRFGQQEDREPYRLKDRNGDPVLCYRCGTSAIPDSLPAAKRARRSTSTAKSDTWKNIVSCDYCDLHWHLDCLDPPLSTMPVFPKKWMCPNHADRALPSRHRVPRAAPVIEITKPKQFNNGNIEIIPSQTPTTSHIRPKMNVDEVLINGRRYRVPERIILLDFWSKIDAKTNGGMHDDDSRMSSPLTSLSSSSDLDETPGSPMDDISAAQMLYEFQQASQTASSSRTPSKSTTVPAPRDIDDKLRRIWPVIKPPAAGSSSTAGPSTTTAKRKKSTPSVPDSTRELRSTRGTPRLGESSSSSKSASRAPEDAPAPVASTSTPSLAPIAPRKIMRVKIEDPERTITSVSAPPAGAVTPKRRNARKSLPDAEGAAEEKPKRGKKRKDRDDDGDYVSKGVKAAANAATATAKGRRKSVRTPTSPTTSSGPPAAAPATPSLKIRLRLNPPASVAPPASSSADTSA